MTKLVILLPAIAFAIGWIVFSLIMRGAFQAMLRDLRRNTKN